jgi:DNA-binding beta-propeller fold protein YncE
VWIGYVYNYNGYINQYDYTSSPSLISTLQITTQGTSTTPYELQCISYDGTYLWVTSYNENCIYYINYNETPLTICGPISTGNKPWGIYSNEVNIWVSCSGNVSGGNSIYQYNYSNLTTPPLIISLSSGSIPGFISYDGKYLWVSGSGSNKVYQIDYSLLPPA